MMKIVSYLPLSAICFVLIATQLAEAAEQSVSSRDNVISIEALKTVAEGGDAICQFLLGLKYAEGDGVTKDYVEAVKWFRAAAEQGDAEAQAHLGVMYAMGNGVTKNEVEAVRWFRKAAEQGNARGQFNLGVAYANGNGVTKDEIEAAKWKRKAAEQGDAKAQFELAGMYLKGEVVTKDYVEAVKWYRAAAEQGDSRGQLLLGTMYASGWGVTKDDVEAVKWYRAAAEQGYAEAQNFLGVRYFKGEGVTKSDVEALKWFRKAAEQGNAKGKSLLGAMYAKGAGVTKDEVEAVRWFREAAEQGDAQGQWNLGVSYSRGASVPKDYVESYKWRLLAASQGHETANETVSVFENLLTREQMAEGQKLAREFKSRAKSQETEVTRENLQESNPEATGSGFFITDDGYFITNQHVAGSGATVRVLTASGIIPAKVIKMDELNDLTLLKAEGKFASLPVVFSRKVQLGATVATVGFPNIGLQGFSPKLAKGEIASLAGIQDDARHFQISVPVQPGNSGGALVDERGNVIGVVVAKLSQKAALATSGSLAENVNYAIKSSYLLSFLESVPEVAAKLKEPNTTQRDFETTIKDVEQAAVLVLVY